MRRLQANIAFIELVSGALKDVKRIYWRLVHIQLYDQKHKQESLEHRCALLDDERLVTGDW